MPSAAAGSASRRRPGPRRSLDRTKVLDAAVGLLDDIRIVDSPELTAYIRDYIAANKLL